MLGRRLFSYRYMVLRASTAAATLGVGVLQTFVFARVLGPQQFSLFILFAALGYSLYLTDAGMVKVLFVSLRNRFLRKEPFAEISAQATGLVIAYFAVAAVAVLICFAVLFGRFNHSTGETIDLTLFFAFNAVNLPWVALRYFSIAIDEYYYFETLEALRRGLTMAALLALLAGLPVLVFLLLINCGWAAIIYAAIAKLSRRRVLGGNLGGNIAGLLAFFRDNRRQIFNSAIYAASETYIYNFPYFLVPWVNGLGAPTIILDTAFKVCRSANQFYSAACDALVPRQTSALAERDGSAMIRATWLATALCGIPAAAASVVLIFFGAKLFAILLGPAAVMPPATTPIIIMLLGGNLAQMISHSVLVHTGYFKEVARISFSMVAAMTGVVAVTIWAHLDILQFLNAYAAVYTCGALVAVATMIRGPIRHAHEIDGAARPVPQ
jgi:hypothetical protein